MFFKNGNILSAIKRGLFELKVRETGKISSKVSPNYIVTPSTSYLSQASHSLAVLFLFCFCFSLSSIFHPLCTDSQEGKSSDTDTEGTRFKTNLLFDASLLALHHSLYQTDL